MKKIVIALTMAFSLTACNQEPAGAIVVPQQEVKKQEVTLVKHDYMSIGINPAEFKALFNEQAKLRKSKFAIPVLTINDGAGGKQFLHQFNSLIGLLGTIEKSDGTIRSLTMMATGDGTMLSGANMMFVSNLIVAATNPSLDLQEAGKISNDLFSQCVGTKGQKSEEIANGIRYACIFDEKIGYVFIADQNRI